MLSVTAAHAALLASGRPLVMAELLTITLGNGIILRYCNAPVVLSYGGNSYQPLNWERGDIVTCLGLEVDEVELTIWPRTYPISCNSVGQQDLIMGIPWMQAVRQKLLFGAEVLLERGDIDPSVGPDIVGTVYLFSGRFAEPSYDDGNKLSIKSDMEVFNRVVPAQIYQPGCPFTLFDLDDPMNVRCGLNKNDWVEGGTVTGAGTNNTFLVGGLAQAAGYFDLGRLEWLSGYNLGLTRVIRAYVPGQIIVSGGFPYVPQVGDAFACWPGCDKQKATCNDKFSNTVVVDGVTVLRYGGQCFVPKPETAI